MKFKKIMIVSLILLAILTVGTVSASSDMDMLSQDAMDSNPVSNSTTYIGDVNVTETNAEFIGSQGPVNPEDEFGMALILQDENSRGNVTVSKLIDDDSWEEVNSVVIDYYNYENDDHSGHLEGIWYYLPVNLLNFDEIDDGQIFRFTFEDDNGYRIESDFRLSKRDEGTIMFETLDEFPYWEVNRYIELNNPDDPNPIVAILDIPCDDEGTICYPGTLYVHVMRGDDIYEIEIPETVTFYDMPWEVRLEDLNYFEGIDDETFIEFRFWVNDDIEEEGSTSEERCFYNHADDGYIELLPLGENDFDVEFWGANVADHGIALGIPIHQDSYIVDNVATFTIEVDFWGDIIRTEWNKDDVSMDEEMYYWTTTDLGIDDRMWDIGGNVNCEVTVIIMDEDDEKEYYACGEVTFVNSPYISCGELSPFTESEPVITFSFFPPADDLFTISIRKDGAFFANRTFKISEMDQYEEDEENYNLYLDDLGISELGEYEVSVRFTDLPRTDEAIYTSTFNVVPFAIRTFTDTEQITDPVFAIALPEDSVGNVIIKVNGTQVFDETLSDIGYTIFFRGDGYYIKLNDLNIAESGYYDVEMTVNAMDVTRTANNEIYVNVTGNTFEFKDAIYMLEGFMDTYLGAPISDSEIVLYLNGKKAATGRIYFEGVSFEYEEGYADIYGCLLPGQYQARLEVGGVAVAEDTFEILDNSRNIDAYIDEVNGEYYLNFKAPWPKCGHLWGYTLNVYVDAYHPDDMLYNDTPVISLCDDEFENLLNEEWHALYIGELEQGNHFIFVEYFIENDDISLEDKDYFIRIFDIVNKVPTDISAVYDGSDVVATLTNGATGQAIKSANVRFIINDVRYTVKSDASGKAKFSTASLDAGTYTVTVSYEGNSKYSPSSASVDIVVKADSILSLDFNNGARELVATLTNGATGQVIKNANVRFEVNGVKSTVKSDANGQAKVSVADLALGTYEATVNYLGNSKYNPSSITVDFTITKIMTSISIYYDESTQELVATLINSETGQAIKGATIVFNYDGVKTSAKSDKFGQARLYIGEPSANNASLSYGGNSKYLKSYASTKIVADKIPTVISNFYYKETQEVVATLINRETGQAIKGATVVFNFNGVKTALKTDKLGQVKLSVEDLIPDEYYISSSYGGNSKYAGSVARISFVKI